MIIRFFFAFVLFPFLVTAQTARFENYTIEDGLSNSRVRAFWQDSWGFIWIGTAAGLNRFDGYRFTIFNHQPGVQGSILHNGVPALLEDRWGNFWVGTKAGLQLLNQEKQVFFPGTEAAGHPLEAIGHVHTLHESRDGSVWVGTANGLFRLSVKGPLNTADRLLEAIRKGTFQVEAFYVAEGQDGGLPNNRVWSLEDDGQGNLWIGTNSGLCRFGLESHSFLPLPFEKTKDSEALFAVPIHAIEAGRDGRLWVGTEKGLYQAEAGLGPSHDLKINPGSSGSLKNDFITEIVEDAQGKIWIGSDGGGLARWAPETGRFVHYQNRLQDPKSLGENNVEALYVDKNSGLWVGTHKGASYYSPFQKPFRAYRPEGVPRSLSPGMVQSIFVRPDGKAWIGIDDGGIDLFDPETGDFWHYREGADNSRHLINNDVVSVL